MVNDMTIKHVAANGIVGAAVIVGAYALGAAVNESANPFRNSNPVKDLALGSFIIGAAIAVQWARNELESDNVAV
jgi:hypothetical protein